MQTTTMYSVEESIGNFSHTWEETFDSREEAQEAIDKVINKMVIEDRDLNDFMEIRDQIELLNSYYHIAKEG